MFCWEVITVGLAVSRSIADPHDVFSENRSSHSVSSESSGCARYGSHAHWNIGIFPLLTGVSIFCLANNTSTVFRNVFGGGSNNEGMGLLSWCFDWNLIGSPCLYNPIWLQINQDIGILLTYVLMSGVYYGNLWQAKQFPFMSQAIFVSAGFVAIDASMLILVQASDGSQYNQSGLLTDGKFDPAKYNSLGVRLPRFVSVIIVLRHHTACLVLGDERFVPHHLQPVAWGRVDSRAAVALEGHYAHLQGVQPVEQGAPGHSRCRKCFSPSSPRVPHAFGQSSTTKR